MGIYVKGYILSFISLVILNAICGIETTYRQVIILTIIWGVLSICHAIEKN